MNIEIGQKISFFPSCWSKVDFPSAAKALRGRVCYINRAHRYFTLEAECHGYVIRECFHFGELI